MNWLHFKSTVNGRLIIMKTKIDLKQLRTDLETLTEQEFIAKYKNSSGTPPRAVTRELERRDSHLAVGLTWPAL